MSAVGGGGAMEGRVVGSWMIGCPNRQFEGRERGCRRVRVIGVG